ncbi:MAG: PAS domain S-box protein [Lunatimonas sp.]|uniref:PAS domain S-box protein n=1 Tax=Lunatimonas sp. TaxID=2060141 RepID=UPI00263B263C|nr:PAS domain S-box protein [Lunatimonas sp.]MCC5935719.1 PAS domain S-box protein [Lunatimonas sp.]
MASSIKEEEQERLRVLGEYHLDGITDLEEFDFLTKMASRICETRISLISVVFEDKQWFLARHGIEQRETPRQYSFCAHALHRNGEMMVVQDARRDPRFQDNPLVLGDPHIVFYAGIPLVSQEGFTFGTLCVIDSNPHVLSDEQADSLKRLATQVMKLLELRKKNLDFEKNELKLRKALFLLEEAQQINQIGAWELDISTGKTRWTEQVYDIHELPVGFDHNRSNGIDFYHPDDRHIIRSALVQCIEKDTPFDVTCRLVTAKGNLKWVRATGKRINGTVVGAFQDISVVKKQMLKFQGIFNSSNSFIGFLDTQGILLDANETALNRAGLKRTDVIGRFFWDCYWWQISEAAQQRLKESFEKVLEGQEIAYEETVLVKDGLTTTILFSLKPVIDESGQVLFIIPEGRPIQDIVDSRNRYRELIESTSAGTFEWDISTGEVVINDRYAQMLGYEKNEIQPISFSGWESHADKDGLEGARRLLIECFKKQREFFQTELRMRHKNGNYIWVNVRGKVISWSTDGRALKMYGTHQEITDRKQREEEAEYQRNILKALYDLSPIGISLNDYHTGEFLDVNAKLLEPTGYEKSEFLGLSYFDITPEEYADKESEAVRNMELSGRYGPLEKQYIRKDGSRYPVLLNGVVIKDLNGRKLIWSVIEDISEKKKREKDLQRAISNLQAVLDAGSQVSIIATDTEGTISLFNTGAEKMLGYSAGEVVGVASPQVFHLEEEVVQEANILTDKYGVEVSGFDVFVFRAKQGVAHTQEWTYIRKDGSKLPVLLSVTAIVQNDHTIGYLGIAVDISQQKDAEKRIETLHQLTMAQNDRLKNFAYIVSHNLRSHSGGISGLLEVLKAVQPEYFENEIVQMIETGSENLMNTIKDLSEVIRVNLDEEARFILSIRPIVRKNIESLRAIIEREKIEVINEVSEDLKIRIIPAYIESITLNFITNAIKYKSPERPSCLKIFSREEKDVVKLYFEDNGLGIDLTKYGKDLFGMYKTFHRHEDSRGVGLYITRNQIEAMGGYVEVESEVGKGTTFVVTLPYE